MIAKISNIDEKVYVNDIEITNSEDWNKVIESVSKLQQENAELEKENRKLKRKLEKLNESFEMFRSFLYYADLAYKESQQKINGDIEDE